MDIYSLVISKLDATCTKFNLTAAADGKTMSEWNYVEVLVCSSHKAVIMTSEELWFIWPTFIKLIRSTFRKKKIKIIIIHKTGSQRDDMDAYTNMSE